MLLDNELAFEDLVPERPRFRPFAFDALPFARESDRLVADFRPGKGHAAACRLELNRQQLYRTLANGGNPEFRTLRAILEAAGFSLAVVPRKPSRKRAASGRRKNLVRARHAAQVVAP